MEVSLQGPQLLPTERQVLHSQALIQRDHLQRMVKRVHLLISEELPRHFVPDLEQLNYDTVGYEGHR